VVPSWSGAADIFLLSQLRRLRLGCGEAMTRIRTCINTDIKTNIKTNIKR